MIAYQGERIGRDVRLILEHIDQHQNEWCDEQDKDDDQEGDHNGVFSLSSRSCFIIIDHYASTSPFLLTYTWAIPMTAQMMNRIRASA